MRIRLIYPKWPKLERQPEFNLPPLGVLHFASSLDKDVDISFCDENVEVIDFDEDADLVALSVMLTCQLPRAIEIARDYRSRGKKIIAGGIAVMLHREEMMQHVDCVFLGEAEERIGQVLDDFLNGEMKPLYDYRLTLPDVNLIRPARRDLLKHELYNFRGVQMVDLFHASRGCRFNCFPCCAEYLGGRQFRPRPIDAVVKELEGIKNNRLFFVDNSMAQDDQWAKELFKAIAPVKKKWVSHPITDDDEVLDLAAEAGCWYVYQAIVNTSDHIRKRIKRLKERGIGVEGTVLLGLDNHDEDYIKRLVDFLLEIDLDLAEFTVLTPFPHTPIRATLESQGRILHNDWVRYTSGEVVFQPAKMSVDALQNMYHYAWESFYADCCKEIKMAKLYLKVIDREKRDGTFRKVTLSPDRSWKTFGEAGKDK